mgnify:CR=1 FL=1
MKVKRIIIILLLLPFLTSCLTKESVDIGDIQEFQIDAVERNTVYMSISLPIENPNMYKISIEEIHLDFSLDEDHLGTLTSSKNIEIPAQSKELHQFELELELKNAFLGALSMVQQLSKKNAEINIEGWVKARALFVRKKIPVSESQSYDWSSFEN